MSISYLNYATLYESSSLEVELELEVDVEVDFFWDNGEFARR